MNKRAFLRSNEGIFSLSPKITIVGRESCDFIIQNITVDLQQAVIEYFESEDCYILKDLNSTHGTYVNECRIQNASVRLADGDILKFGFSTGQYEFRTEDLLEGDVDVTTTYTQIPITQRQSWQHNPQQPPTSAATTTLPIINYSHPQQIQQRMSGLGSWTQLPRTPASNPKLGRPLSANNLNRRQITPTAPIGSSSGSSTFRRGSVSGPIKQYPPDHRTQTNEDINITELQNEIERLRYVENLCQEKSKQIENLVQQNNELLNSGGKSMSEEVYEHIKELTDEVNRKCTEVERLQRIVDRTTDNSNRHNTNSSNNESEIGLLRQELENLRKDLQISNGLVTTLQKDLSNNDEVTRKLNREIELLHHEITEKDISITALMNKLGQLKDVQDQIQGGETEKQDKERELISLKHKLKSAESSSQEKEQELVPLRKTVEEFKQTEKANSDSIRELSLKLDETKALVADLERSESILRVDAKESENKYEKFRSKVLHLALSSPGFKAGNNALKDDEIIDIMKELVKSKVEHDRRICEKQKLYDAEIQKQQQMVEEIEQLRQKVHGYSETLGPSDRTSNRILGAINGIKKLKVNEALSPLIDVLLENLKNEMEFLSTLESCISDAGPELANLSLSECFKRIIERSIDAYDHRAKTESQLAEVLETHAEEIQRLNREHEEAIAEAIKNQNSLNEANFQVALEEALRAEQEKSNRLCKEVENKLREYEENNGRLQETVSEKEAKCREAVLSLIERTNQVESLERQLKEAVDSKTTLEQSLCEQFDTINIKWKKEIEAYKEETFQHAITINSLNDRLIKLDNENKDLLNELTQLRTNIQTKKQTKKVVDNEETNPVMFEEVNNFNSTIASLERCVSALRHENVHLKNKNLEFEDTVKGLNMDLLGAEARLSDLKGELSESQKNEIDRLNSDIRKLESETSDLQVQLSKMSTLVDNLIQELEEKKTENKNLVQQITEEKLKVQERETKIQDLESSLAFEKENWLHHINQIEQEGRISMELAVIGSQCRGDRHVQIIEAQKVALVELRQKMKTIEMTRLPNSNVPEVTQQMLQLKKELAELRAKQALRDGAPRGVNSLTDMIHNKTNQRKVGFNVTEPEITKNTEENKILKSLNESVELAKNNRQMKFDLDVAKATNFDVQQNFELSEASYFQLVKQLLEVLDIGSVKGAQTLDNLPYEAKQNLKIEREENCGMIIQKIRILKEMIQRKDELLHSYETDLVKLKQAEDLTAKTQAQIDHIVLQSRSKGEEVDLLRETLNRTKDLLNQEKRVNSAIKHNKHYVPDKNLAMPRGMPDTPKFHCPQEDIMGKDKQNERNKSEKMKRKDYEIKSLKSELYSKEKELSHATNRLNTLETTMGIKSEEPVA